MEIYKVTDKSGNNFTLRDLSSPRLTVANI